MENTAGPTIFRSSNIQQTASQISKNPQGWFRKNIIRIALVVLVVAVLGEVVFGTMTLFSPASARKLNILQPDISEIKDPQISLVAEKTAYKKGETVVVGVKLFTGGYTTTSTDLVIKYDPVFLKPIGENFVSVGQIYSEYPPIQTDTKGGLIGVSGITMQGQEGFSGVGEFAKLNFTALRDGQTEVTADFKPGETADSNVVLAGTTKDILGKVMNAQIQISPSASGTATVPSGKSCESFTQYCQDSGGKVGTQICKAGTINNGCSYDPLLSVSCEVCKIQ